MLYLSISRHFISIFLLQKYGLCTAPLFNYKPLQEKRLFAAYARRRYMYIKRQKKSSQCLTFNAAFLRRTGGAAKSFL